MTTIQAYKLGWPAKEPIPGPRINMKKNTKIKLKIIHDIDFSRDIFSIEYVLFENGKIFTMIAQSIK